MERDTDGIKASPAVEVDGKAGVAGPEGAEPALSGSERAVAAILEADQEAAAGREIDSEEAAVLTQESTAGVADTVLPDDLEPGVIPPSSDTYAEASEAVLSEPLKVPPRRTGSRRGGAPLGEGVTVEELLTTELASRAAEATPQLRTHLTGKFIIEIRDTGDRYLFNWSQDTPVLGKTEETTGDCVISLDGGSVVSIAEGKLNPQIAMLSHKIRVTGRLVLAMYFFNLLHPNGFGQSLS